MMDESSLVNVRVLAWRQGIKTNVIAMVFENPSISVSRVRGAICKKYGISHRRFAVYLKELLDDEDLFIDGESLSAKPFETYSKLYPEPEKAQ